MVGKHGEPPLPWRSILHSYPLLHLVGIGLANGTKPMYIVGVAFVIFVPCGHVPVAVHCSGFMLAV
jgi:hypothetical protein